MPGRMDHGLFTNVLEGSFSELRAEGVPGSPHAWGFSEVRAAWRADRRGVRPMHAMHARSGRGSGVLAQEPTEDGGEPVGVFDLGQVPAVGYFSELRPEGLPRSPSEAAVRSGTPPSRAPALPHRGEGKIRPLADAPRRVPFT